MRVPQMSRARVRFGVLVLLVAGTACSPSQKISDQELERLLQKLSMAELNDVLAKTQSEDAPSRTDFQGRALKTSRLFAAAQAVKGAFHRAQLMPRHENLDQLAVKIERDYLPLDEAEPLPLDPCPYSTAAELMASCPTQQEIRQIRQDFNIYFERPLIEHGVLVPWSCTPGGEESSLMLSMYNSFRLSRCIPFDASFPWAPEHENLYEWMQSTELTAIGYFWADEGDHSHGWNKRIYLIGNWLADPMYRAVSDPSAGVGLINYVALIAHETRHADVNIGHNCGSDDTDLDYMGAWAVHYHLAKMLAENTGDYFSNTEKSLLSGLAQTILGSRFCDL